MGLTGSEKKTSAMPSSKRRKAIVPSRKASVADDILTEVLLRLPIKSVVRFRAVCRSWAALLSSEEFCRLHQAITKAAGVPQKLLHFFPTARFGAMAAYSCSLEVPGDDELLFTLDYARGKRVEVLTPASCHGLTLLYDALAKAYYICNAATRAVKRLPHSAVVRLHMISTGLGFDDHTREYKVVRLINGINQYHDQDAIRCEVYTPGGSHGDRWRLAAGGVPFGLRRFAASAVSNAVEQRLAPVFANGFLHWLIHPCLLFKRPRGAIIYFSVMEETFRCVRAPPFPSSYFGQNPPFLAPPGLDLVFAPQARPEGHLMEMDNQLCLVRDLRGNPYGSSLEIWRLLDYSSGDWSLDHRIDLSGNVLGRELREPQTVRVIGSIDPGRPGKKVIITTCKHKVHEMFEKKVHTYDLSSQNLETILSVTEASTSTHGIYEKPLPSRFGLFEDCLAPMHKTDEEIALSSTLSKVVKEILLRLPAKSVVQSKLVCRQWLWLIKSESFMRSYFEHKNIGRRLKLMLVGKGTGQSAFHFAPLDTWLRESPSHYALLDTKVVCSKPCHGMNLVSTATRDYLYNPGTGFHRVYFNPGPQIHLALESQRIYEAEQHAFAVGSKNVGLTFDPLSGEHVMVEIVYQQKNYHSRRYRAVCELRWCNSVREYSLPLPPLPVTDMPPANVGGVLYWMSDPRLGRSYERAIVSFDISTRLFDTIHCPSCITDWSTTSPCRAFVVELQGALCAVLADPVENSLDIWRLERGRCIWGRACTIRLDASPDYTLVTNVVVPLAVDPKDGGILLSTGRKLGVYDPVKQTIQSLYSQDQVPLAASVRHLGVSQGSKFTSSEDNSAFCEEKSVWGLNRMDSEILPLVPMLYEESLACYPCVGLAGWLSFC